MLTTRARARARDTGVCAPGSRQLIYIILKFEEGNSAQRTEPKSGAICKSVSRVNGTFEHAKLVINYFAKKSTRFEDRRECSMRSWRKRVMDTFKMNFSLPSGTLFPPMLVWSKEPLLFVYIAWYIDWNEG